MNLDRVTSRPLGEILASQGALSPDQIQRTNAQAKAQGGHLGERLVKDGLITEGDLARTLCAQFQIPHLDVSRYEVPAEVAALLPLELLTEHCMAPVDRFGDLLVLALASPIPRAVADEMARLTNCELAFYVATFSAVRRLLEGRLREVAGAPTPTGATVATPSAPGPSPALPTPVEPRGGPAAPTGPPPHPPEPPVGAGATWDSTPVPSPPAKLPFAARPEPELAATFDPATASISKTSRVVSRDSLLEAVRRLPRTPLGPLDAPRPEP
ncbi:MAG: hypothetical protein HY722_01855, partial [Planctomycetes bacterium]|nr:hypothetical protein [Planctomycetota bacterium]